MTVLFLDLETFSTVPIKHGTHAYAEAAEVMVFAYAIDEEPVIVLDLINDPNALCEMEEVLSYVGNYVTTVVAHNSHFDRTVLRHCGYDIPVQHWHDTMVRALCHGLPGSLDKLSDIFKLGDKAKDKEGKKLIQLFCVPRPKKQKLRRATKDTHPAEWQKFLDYAELDIEAMRVLYKRLPRWNYQGAELDLWLLDQKINDRGVTVDLDLANAAIETVTEEQKRLKVKTNHATFGEVGSATQRAKLLKFINEYWELDLPDLKADTIDKILKDDPPWDLRDLLLTRLQASTTSTTKYKRVVSGVSSDGRLRGLIQFCGAPRTARDAGRLLQPQNLMRPTMKNAAIEDGIAAMKGGYAAQAYDNVMEVAANAMRGVIVASEGKKLVVADLSNIEGVSAAWLAQEDWKLTAFRAYFAGKGEDLYKTAYARMFNVDPSEVGEGSKRQIGKVAELMLQYEGGVGAFLTGAATYGIDLDAMAQGAIDMLPANIRREANKAFGWAMKKDKTYGLAENTFIVCDAFKRMWREAHPGITAMWALLDEAMREAVETPSKEFPVGTLTVKRDGKWLKIILPSGRALSYPSPKVERGKISYMGLSTFSRQWKRISTYGGKAFENVTQAFARDIFKGTDMLPGNDNILTTQHRIEAAGYNILIPVHDELVTEIWDGESLLPGTVCAMGSAEHLSSLMATPPRWASDIPLAAKGFETYRYRKG